MLRAGGRQCPLLYTIQWDRIQFWNLRTGVAVVAKKSKRERRTLIFPKHWFDPKDWLTFVQAQGFSDDWDGLGLTDDDLAALEIIIMSKPRGWPVVKGTGGLRKMRFSPPGYGKGKSGALRALYVYFDEFGVVLLVACYPKSEMDDFPQSYKKAFKDLIKRQHEALVRRSS
jgi:hypothetical protein